MHGYKFNLHVCINYVVLLRVRYFLDARVRDKFKAIQHSLGILVMFAPVMLRKIDFNC